MATIFISYRREDSADVTGRIRDRLEASFGREEIFTDVDSIPLGVDFKAYLDERVGNCECFLPVIGPRWLNVTDSNGRRRLDDPGDFVRAEIEAALRRDVPVIPVLVQGASMPTADQLPENLRSLATRNGLAIRPDPDFRTDMDRLIKGITGHDKRRDRPSSQIAWISSSRRVLTYIGGSLVALTVALWLWTQPRFDDRLSRTTPEPPVGTSPSHLDWTTETPTNPTIPGPPVETSPDWRTAAAEVRTVDGEEYYEVDFAQGLTASAVCSLVHKVPDGFATDRKVCKAFHPDANEKIANSGDRAVVYCTGKEGGICNAYKNACIVCDNCKSGVAAGEWGGRLYGKMYTTCR